MSVFNQRGQHVNYQYNSAGNINFLNVRSNIDFYKQLQELQNEFALAVKANVLEDSVRHTMDKKLQSAVEESRKETPSRKTILDNLNEAKALIEGIATAAGLLTALSQAIEVAKGLFVR